jgi:Fe2+ or Zn2+ uptake regulation protein
MTPSPADRYAEFLARRGQRFTEQGAKVVDAAFAVTGPFAVEDLVASLRGTVGRAVVYRTLSKLTQAELIRPVQFNGRSVFVAAVSSEEGDD